jgi:hypothetical protein
MGAVPRVCRSVAFSLADLPCPCGRFRLPRAAGESGVSVTPTDGLAVRWAAEDYICHSSFEPNKKMLGVRMVTKNVVKMNNFHSFNKKKHT